MKIRRCRPDYSKGNCGATELLLMALSIGVSVLAGYLLRKKNKSPIEDDRPTVLTTRGSHMTWFVGIRPTDVVFAWAGDREKRKESAEGGKGFGSPKIDVWYEAGWHQLAVGPVYALHSIEVQGKVIFSGPITSDSHPSGSTIDLGEEGSFSIFWGEVNQPVNTFLGAATRTTVSSRWPHCCYVVWNKKRLGPSPQWQIMRYVLERRPSQAVLSSSQAWYEPSSVLDGEIADVYDSVANANENIGYLEVVGDLSQEFDPGREVNVVGNGLPNGDYGVLRTEVVQVVIGTGFGGFPIYETHTRVFFQGGTAGANDNGTIQAYSFGTDDGTNIAHAIAEMLFANWPLGLNLNPDGVEPWDKPSLEALGVEAEADGWRASLIATDGDTVEALLGAALQDHGTMLPINTSNGKILFQRIREPVGILPDISANIIAEELPEIEVFHGDRPVDKMVFAFADRDNGYSKMTIAIDDDGQTSYLEYQNAREVGIASTTHFATAGQLSELRSQEELAGVGAFRLTAMRAARELIPGQAIVASGFDEVLRVEKVDIDPLSEVIKLTVMPDFYANRKSDFVNNEGGGGSNLQDPAQDVQFAALEVPEALLTVEDVFLQVPRVRAHAQIVAAAIHLSRDNSTYTLQGEESGVAAGGTLDTAMTTSSASFHAQGPTFTALGPDIATVQDLSSDPINFGLGRQLVVFSSVQGIEIGFLQKITSLGGGQYRMDGLLRARYDTRKLANPVGTKVFILSDSELVSWDDVLLIPGEDLYTKSQPFTNGGSVSLASVPPFGAAIRGKGVVPIDPEGMYVAAPAKGSPSYVTGSDVTVRWAWSSSTSKNTGAGYQPAGTPVGAAPMKGVFIVELLTSAGAVIQTASVSVPEIIYDNATLAASPINETTFKVRVHQSYNGYDSNSVTLTVTKV